MKLNASGFFLMVHTYIGRNMNKIYIKINIIFPALTEALVHIRYTVVED